MSQHDARTWVRFLAAGVINTLFGWAVYSGCILTGAPPWLALLIATPAGIAFNFLTFAGYAFRDMAWRRLPRFASCYVVLYALNLACISLLSYWIESPIWVQAILTPPMAMASYLLLSRMVFTSSTQ